MTDSKFCEHGVNVGLKNPPVFCGQCPPDTIESLRAQLAEVTDELEIMRHQRDQAQDERDEARAEVERLRKIFDDAGQGEFNILALIDHYQDAAIAADERARAYLLDDSRAMDAAQSVVDKARELLSYDWQCRLEDCEVGDSARNDARELEHAIAEWDRAMGCDE